MAKKTYWAVKRKKGTLGMLIFSNRGHARALSEAIDATVVKVKIVEVPHDR